MKGPVIYYEIKDMFGTDLSSTKLATQLNKDIMNDIDLGFNVEIDFKDVKSISNGWAKNAFGLIVKDKGDKFFKDHILISNLNKNIKISILEKISNIKE